MKAIRMWYFNLLIWTFLFVYEATSVWGDYEMAFTNFCAAVFVLIIIVCLHKVEALEKEIKEILDNRGY